MGKPTGREPCGECHLQEGETCDICGAKAMKPSCWLASQKQKQNPERQITN